MLHGDTTRRRQPYRQSLNQPQPHTHDDLSVNHGGVAILALPETSLSSRLTGPSPTPSEVAAGHVTTNRRRVVVHRSRFKLINAIYSTNWWRCSNGAARDPLAFVVGDFDTRPLFNGASLAVFEARNDSAAYQTSLLLVFRVAFGRWC
jgi:hypothetical protein